MPSCRCVLHLLGTNDRMNHHLHTGIVLVEEVFLHQQIHYPKISHTPGKKNGKLLVLPRKRMVFLHFFLEGFMNKAPDSYLWASKLLAYALAKKYASPKRRIPWFSPLRTSSSSSSQKPLKVNQVNLSKGFF